MPILLLTRPQAQARVFLAQLTQALGFEVPHLISPLSHIVPIKAEIPQEGELILTSGRAVELAGDLTGRKVWCVGRVTADMAEAAGAEARSADADVEALLALLLAEARAKLTHLRGEDSAGNLVARLRAAGREVDERILYRAERLPLSQAAKELLTSGETVIAPVFSPRGARFLAEDAPAAPSHLIAISAAAARAYEQAAVEGAQISTVDSPDATAMLKAVQKCWGNLS